MKLDPQFKLPIENGATDWRDSARLAGLLATFFELKIIQPKLEPDLYLSKGRLIRHPFYDEETISRDQIICLVMLMRFHENSINIPFPWPSNADILTPSQIRHIMVTMYDKKPWWNFFANIWLLFDVLWSAYVKPKAEPNQIICMLMSQYIYGDGVFYLRLWTKLNKQWKSAIRIYWCLPPGDWRGERELAEEMIDAIEGIVSGN